MPLPVTDEADSSSVAQASQNLPRTDSAPRNAGDRRLAASTSDPRARLRKIPVPISVRLAEKRIPVSQLLGLTPGALIMFNKSVEDLLDLYVNNIKFCRGEAVKVGESFGLKINQMALPREAGSKIVHS